MLKMALLSSYIMIIKVIISHRVTKINPVLFYIAQLLGLLYSYNIRQSTTIGPLFSRKETHRGKYNQDYPF